MDEIRVFNHSVKVPRLYKVAAKIAQEVAKGGASIKQLVYEKKHFNTKALYALVATTFCKAHEIDLVLKRTHLLVKEPRFDPWLAKILISELIWGKKTLPQNECKPIQTILAYEQVFKAHLSDSSEDILPGKTRSYKPRYVRINTLKTPYNEGLDNFQNEDWVLQKLNNKNDYKSFLEQVANLKDYLFMEDMHIPSLLVFPSGTEFYNHPGYKQGSIILQDKASCLPVHILSPPPGSNVLDMCAAPGMKTTQLAAILNDQGTVYAVERDQRRFDTLNKMIESSGATCVRTINKDVLQCNDTDFPNVEYILVDPSCSGSGMTDRVDTNTRQDSFRLQKLAGFQIKILRHALTKYPTAKRVVYSTCSLYPEENEDVVRQVLETNNNFKLVSAKDFVNNAWTNLGSPDFGEIGIYCLYARPEQDFTNGFFVAVFERLGEGENNQFFNRRVLNFRKTVEKNEQMKKKRERKRKGLDEDDRIGLDSIDGVKNYNVSDDSLKNAKKKKHKKNIVECKSAGFDGVDDLKIREQRCANGNNDDSLKIGNKKKKLKQNVDKNDNESYENVSIKKIGTKSKKKEKVFQENVKEEVCDNTVETNVEMKTKRENNRNCSENHNNFEVDVEFHTEGSNKRKKHKKSKNAEKEEEKSSRNDVNKQIEENTSLNDESYSEDKEKTKTIRKMLKRSGEGYEHV